MLQWSWNEHRLAAQQLGESPAAQVILLIDELESHLHPRWQRSILGSLLKLASLLHRNAKIQLITATHSPLVLASAEPTFDSNRMLGLTSTWITPVTESEYSSRSANSCVSGDVSNWLTSEAFDLKEHVSIEGETAVRQAPCAVTTKRTTEPE